MERIENRLSGSAIRRMNALKLAFRQLPQSLAVPVLTLALHFSSRAFAELAVQRVEIAAL